MVQLPATAAIEYVAACWVHGAGGDFCPGVLLSGGSFAQGTSGVTRVSCARGQKQRSAPPPRAMHQRRHVVSVVPKVRKIFIHFEHKRRDETRR